jgi:hypothetical protein
MSKSAAQLDHEIDDKDLADFAAGKFKYDVHKRARLAYLVAGILRDRGVATVGADNEALDALARIELTHSASATAKASPCANCKGTGTLPVPTDEPGRFGKATHLSCAHCGGSGERTA